MAKFAPDSSCFDTVSTPALVVDVGAMNRNITVMARQAASKGVALRPHAKTHKSVDIARRQLAAGAAGIACATVSEIEHLAGAGIRDLLLTAPIASADKASRLAAVAAAGTALSVVVDHEDQLPLLSNALKAHGGVTVPVLIDTNVGQNRTGINDLQIGVALAQKVHAKPYLTLKGIQGFAGQAQHIASEPDRRKSAAAVQDHLQRFRQAVEAVGLSVDCISGSGTGTSLYDYTGPYTELQVGSYIFMDADYQSINGAKEEGLGFETSLYVLATVVSTSIAGQVTVDAGVKALAFNGPAPKIILGAPAGTTYRFAGDEHGILQLPEGADQPKLGTKVLLQTTHCDPSVNLYSQYQAYLPDGSLETWPIGGRYV